MSPSSARALALPLGLALAPLFPARLAAAEPAPAPASDSGRALEVGRRGIAHYERGQWQLAIETFQQAETLYHSPVFVLYVARSLRNMNRLLDARAEFERLLAERLDDSAPAAWKQAQGDGRAELAALNAQIPSVVIRVEGGSAATLVTLDRRKASAGTAIEVDPGTHVASAVDGGRQASTEFVAVAHERKKPVTVSLVPLHRGPYVPGLVVAGTGALALIAGGVVGALALSRSNEAEQNLPAGCMESVCLATKRAGIEESFEPAYRLATTADVLFISGSALLATGLVLMLIDPRDTSVAPRRTALGVSF